MPPKKKTNKKGGDDWEADLGETAPHVEDAAPNAATEAGEDEFPAGGLMAAMKKNRNKKKAKGKPADDLGDANGGETPVEEGSSFDPSIKAPDEATMDDEFSLPNTKTKIKGPEKSAPAEDEGDEERGADGRVMTKKEKEKAKKEREKQRKKEQVRTTGKIDRITTNTSETLGRKKEDRRTSCKGRRRSKTRYRNKDRDARARCHQRQEADPGIGQVTKATRGVKTSRGGEGAGCCRGERTHRRGRETRS